MIAPLIWLLITGDFVLHFLGFVFFFFVNIWFDFFAPKSDRHANAEWTDFRACESD